MFNGISKNGSKSTALIGLPASMLKGQFFKADLQLEYIHMPAM